VHDHLFGPVAFESGLPTRFLMRDSHGRSNGPLSVRFNLLAGDAR
jgi:hypothetical protein